VSLDLVEAQHSKFCICCSSQQTWERSVWMDRAIEKVFTMPTYREGGLQSHT